MSAFFQQEIKPEIASDMEVHITLLGDSLMQGLHVTGKTWFDMQYHKGAEIPAFRASMAKKSNKFSVAFNVALESKPALKKYLSELIISYTVHARSGLSLATLDPTVNVQFVGNQLNAASVFSSTLNDVQTACMVIGLGANDLKDISHMMVEQFLRILNETEFTRFMTDYSKNLGEDSLLIKLRSAYQKIHQESGMLTADACFTKEENGQIIDLIHKCYTQTGWHYVKLEPPFRENINEFIRDWKRDSCTPEEICNRLNALIELHAQSQLTEQRGYGIQYGIILPPILQSDCPYPAFRLLKKRIVPLRTALEQYAKSKNYLLIDLQEVLQQGPSHEAIYAVDNVHLTSAAYKIIDDCFPFHTIISASVKSQLTSNLSKISMSSSERDNVIASLDELLEVATASIKPKVTKVAITTPSAASKTQ